ncbi:DYL2 protein, partial [Chloroceryle aenea]|nr:DYL2 protein [Chloroceryle aenea]
DQTAIIKDVNMSEEMKQDVVEFASLAIENHYVESKIVALVKRELEKKYSPIWHCIVERIFGSSVSHETKHFIFFLVLGVNNLPFKAG